MSPPAFNDVAATGASSAAEQDDGEILTRTAFKKNSPLFGKRPTPHVLSASQDEDVNHADTQDDKSQDLEAALLAENARLQAEEDSKIRTIRELKSQIDKVKAGLLASHTTSTGSSTAGGWGNAAAKHLSPREGVDFLSSSATTLSPNKQPSGSTSPPKKRKVKKRLVRKVKKKVDRGSATGVAGIVSADTGGAADAAAFDGPPSHTTTQKGVTCSSLGDDARALLEKARERRHLERRGGEGTPEGARSPSQGGIEAATNANNKITTSSTATMAERVLLFQANEGGSWTMDEAEYDVEGEASHAGRLHEAEIHDLEEEKEDVASKAARGVYTLDGVLVPATRSPRLVPAGRQSGGTSTPRQHPWHEENEKAREASQYQIVDAISPEPDPVRPWGSSHSINRNNYLPRAIGARREDDGDAVVAANRYSSSCRNDESNRGTVQDDVSNAHEDDGVAQSCSQAPAAKRTLSSSVPHQPQFQLANSPQQFDQIMFRTRKTLREITTVFQDIARKYESQDVDRPAGKAQGDELDRQGFQVGPRGCRGLSTSPALSSPRHNKVGPAKLSSIQHQPFVGTAFHRTFRFYPEAATSGIPASSEDEEPMRNRGFCRSVSLSSANREKPKRDDEERDSKMALQSLSPTSSRGQYPDGDGPARAAASPPVATRKPLEPRYQQTEETEDQQRSPNFSKLLAKWKQRDSDFSAVSPAIGPHSNSFQRIQSEQA
ncbi:unnamed protein product [Amoebophrya sp. A120]|nr:unnamed protein product [Amoebophrya sp. A120]|eukprot:GSA120T00017128001.1